MFDMISQDITAPYSRLEAWSYDRFIAPAVNDYVRDLQASELEHVVEGGKVLDVGCGGGQNLLSLAATRTDLKLCGLDLSPRQVARAGKRGASFGSRLSFVEGSAFNLPFADNEFDLVVSIGSIKHWPDMQRGVAECARVLAPGGILLIAEADRGCYLDDARKFVQRWRVPGLLGVFALAGFRTWVAGQGVDLVEAQALLDSVSLRDANAARVTDSPFLVIGGRGA